MTSLARHAVRIAVAVLAAGAAVGIAATPSAGAATPTIRLANDVLPHLASARDLGATSGSRHVQIDISLARPHPAAEQALYRAMYTPGSAQYHQFLTPSEFDSRFGGPTSARRRSGRT